MIPGDTALLSSMSLLSGTNESGDLPDVGFTGPSWAQYEKDPEASSGETPGGHMHLLTHLPSAH